MVVEEERKQDSVEARANKIDPSSEIPEAYVEAAASALVSAETADVD